MAQVAPGGYGPASALATASRGAWLVDFDLGGQRFRVASRTVEVYSREVGSVVRYQSGLGEDLNLDVDTESVVLALSPPPGVTWSQARRRFGPFTGRRARLWRWYQGDLEDGYLALQGVLDRPSWASPDQPDTLQITLRRDLESLALTHPPEDAKVDARTWPVRELYPIDESVRGSYYPTVLGHPGSRAGLTSTAPPLPASPGLLVEGLAHPTSVLLVAGHPVQAATVEVWDLSAEPPIHDRLAVFHTEDKLGREVACVDFVATSLTAIEGHEYVVGWDRRAEYGGGLVHGSRLVAGLGDLLIWGADTLSEAVHDRGAMAARRDALNAYRIGTTWNQPTDWEAWLQSHVLDLFELEAVHGPRGLYYRQRVYTPKRPEAVARLTTTAEGVRVDPVGSSTETTEDPINQFTLDFDPAAMSTTQFRRRLVIGAEARGLERGAGAEDFEVRGDLRCRASRTALGRLIPRTWTSVLVGDPGTAGLVLQRKVARHALPAQLRRYRGGVGLLDLRRYQTVILDDPDAEIEDQPALVWGLTLTSQDTVEVDLRIPDDPLTSPTWAAT